MTAEVRRAGPADARSIARVHSETWRLTYHGLLSGRYLARLDEDVLAERWSRQLARRRRDQSVLVAETGGHVVGFCVSRPCPAPADLVGFAGEIEMLYVEPAVQRRKLGRALFARAAEELAARPLYWLVVEVVEGNHAARAFYRRVGLALDRERRVELIEGEPVAVVRYAGPLNPLLDASLLAGMRRPVGGSSR